MSITVSEFLFLRNHLPVVDVRSEGEFGRGHIPGAFNIPVLNNAEREAVGTDYAQKGQLQAIQTGLRLVQPRLNDIITETKRIAGSKELLVHCWRGGLRSSNYCQFAQNAGIKTLPLQGGYKSYRNVVFEAFKKPFQFVVIGGYTGSGKSDILRALAHRGEQVIDLEKLASHKGSAFGGLMQLTQPTTEQFQNNLCEEILKLDISKRIWLEDESISIGKIFLPDDFWKAMCASPVVEIAVDKPVRIRRLVKEYGEADRDEFLKAMNHIAKRLGGQRFKAAKESLLKGDMASTIDMLLVHYDKAYLHGLEKIKSRIISTLNWDGENVDTFVKGLVNTAF